MGKNEEKKLVFDLDTWVFYLNAFGNVTNVSLENLFSGGALRIDIFILLIFSCEKRLIFNLKICLIFNSLCCEKWLIFNDLPLKYAIF